MRLMPSLVATSRASGRRCISFSVLKWVVSFQASTSCLWHSPQASGPATLLGSGEPAAESAITGIKRTTESRRGRDSFMMRDGVEKNAAPRRDQTKWGEQRFDA